MTRDTHMADQRDVWVFVEQEDGEIAPVSLELLGKARELAEQLGSRVCALLFGIALLNSLSRPSISEPTWFF